MLSKKRKVIISRSTHKALEVLKMVCDLICCDIEHRVGDSTIKFEDFVTGVVKAEVGSHIFFPATGGLYIKVYFDIYKEPGSDDYSPICDSMVLVETFLGFRFNLSWSEEGYNLSPTEAQINGSAKGFKEFQEFLKLKNQVDS